MACHIKQYGTGYFEKIGYKEQPTNKKVAELWIKKHSYNGMSWKYEIY